MLKWLRKRFAAASAARPTKTKRQGRSPPLLRLPQELLDMVFDYLDVPDAASLSLCSKDLLQRLDTTGWEDLRPDREHEDCRQELLLRLARDNPKPFFCRTCAYLHRVASVVPALNRGHVFLKGPPCIGNPRLPLNALWWHSFPIRRSCSMYRKTFPHVQLVMERHRLGQDKGIPLSMLAGTEVQNHRIGSFWTLHSMEPSIIEDELFLRIQDWVIFDAGDKPDRSKLRKFHDPGICMHLDQFSTTVHTLGCQSGHIGERSSCQSCALSYRCRHCGVEFESDSMRLDDGEMAVFITKWLHMGKGESSSDPRWRRHLLRSLGNGQAGATTKFWPDIQRTFEQRAGKSVELKTRENVSLIARRSLRWKWNDPTSSTPGGIRSDPTESV